MKKLYLRTKTANKIQKKINTFFCSGSFIGLIVSFFLLIGVAGYANNEVGNNGTIAKNTITTTTSTTFTSGVYIIDMGQATQTVNNGLKPYGLVYALIAAGIPVNWAIEPTKAKDGIDFYATTAANGNKAYKGGSFIIDVVTYPAALSIINSWKSANAGLVVDGPTTASFSAPIYKTLTIWPRAFLDSANDNLITPYYTNAGIPSGSYVINSNPTLLPQCGSSTGTQDLYILPHADPDTWTSTWIESLQNFIDNGGSMWAGCHAVSVMEGLTGCNFLSVNGLINYKTPGHTDGSPAYTYLASASADPIMQFMGIADAALQGGSEDIYLPGPSGWRNTTVLSVYDANYVDAVPNPDVAYTYPNAAAVIAYGRAFGDSSKGMIMYEASHSIGGTTSQAVAAQRAFFNFLLLSGGQPQNTISPPNIANQTTTTCNGVTFNFTPSGAASNVKYTWTTPTGSGFTGGSAQTVGQTTISQTLTNSTSSPVTAVYTVTPKIGGCAGNPFTLTVTVYPTPPTVTLTSGAGTNIVTTPINVAMVNITYTTTNATGATFTGLPPGVTGSWVSNVITISGTPTAVGVYNYTVNVLGYSTCGGVTATGTITTYVCPTFSLLSTTSSSVNVCVGSSSLVTLTANAANLPVGTYTVSYEIQGVTQTPAVMIVTTAGTGSFVDTGFTSIGVRTITITNIASGLCSSVINTNNMDTVTVVATLAAPTALAGSGATCTQITANWQATSGTTYYELDVATDSGFTTFVPGYNALNVGLVTSYNVTGLTSGTTYYYRIRAFNGLCISSSSGTITYATAAAPTAPTGLVTIVNACDELTVGWNAVSGATSYEIQWSTTASNFSVILGTTTGLTSLSYTITGLTNGTKYKFRVRAVNGCSSSAYTTSGDITAAGSVPTRPASITASLILCNQITVTWPAVTGATSYKVEWSTTVANFAPILGTATGITTLDYTITGLTPSTSYLYRVYAENGCGLSTSRAGVSTTTLASAPSAPTGVATSSVSCTQFTVSWTASAGAISYTVERASDSGFTSGLVTVTGVLSSPYTFTGLNSGTIYYYRVRAVSCSSSANATGSPNFITTSSTLPATPTVSTSGALTFCQTDSVTLGSSAGTTYLWSTGETTQFIFVTTAGDYTVQVTNASGCQSAPSLPATVIVQGLPTATAGGSQAICSNGTATVSGATATNGTIAWTENGAGSITAGATTLTPTYTPAAGDAGNTVTLTMTVTSNNTCAPQTIAATYTVNVSGAPSPPTISTITQPTGCNAATGSVLLTNLPSGGTLNPGNISYSGTSYTVTGLNPGTYNFTVTSGTCTSLASANVVINPAVILDNSWDGTAWSLGHPPTSGTERIIFYAGYTATSDLRGCSCQIISGNVVIDSSSSLILTNEVTVNGGGTLTFNNNASLVQINNVTNTGSINYIRIATSIKGTDYVYWSSPVSNQTISGIYTSPTQGPKYEWNTLLNNGNGAFGNISQGSWVTASGTMTPAKGYIVRGSYIGTPATNITSTFAGVPNNGNIAISVYRGAYTGVNYVGANGATITKHSDNQNLLGNPYPSSINALQFLSDNSSVIAGSLSLWTHGTDPSFGGTNPYYGSYAYNYSSNDYLTINYTGSTNPSTGEIVKAGQAFFVRMIDGPTGSGTVNFTNSLRRDGSGNPYSNSNFFRTNEVKNTTTTVETPERNRIWLDIIDVNNLSKTTLVGYVTGATTEPDHFYDAITTPNGNIDIYSLIGNETFIIQGKSMPFDVNDEVPLGFKVATSGTFHIAIKSADGIFENSSQGIYLEDTALGIIHDLRAAPYLFSADTGIYNSRFILRYTNESLGNNNPNDYQTYAFIANNHLQVQSNIALKEIVLFDISGKLIKTYKPDVLRNQFDADFFFANGAYIAKIKLDNGIIVNRKLLH